ncbi:formyltetrahydrofolate deformylase [Blyttiomyces helicus]|uniref:Formyltetrahydrofolate deformylase n=1 Tax=Blyttiomyces helicus TaxID=388810 RepID=A0A4P9W1R8_9FUNG|nr:formyltetrahydrofolate deformylase [Blyttiomyces helicus]|eukprot:RKO86141.1 formyltetrahydrofolate deformylase [Blyttiomyces helicus]
MPAPKTPTAILLLVCKDTPGIVTRLTSFIAEHGGNLVDVDFHVDADDSGEKLFLGRLEWELPTFTLPRASLPAALETVCTPFAGRWTLHFSDTTQRIAVFVSKQDHCMLDLLRRTSFDDVDAQIVLVVSNHLDLKPLADHAGIAFHHIPITASTKQAQEVAELELLKAERVDVVVMAKYMQILSPTFIEGFPNTINIHHSFLPAFVGGKPYHQAFARGVKIIGATAHFATAELDAGPIIEQECVRISHRDTVQDLIRKGQDVERSVLSRAVRLHLLHRILPYGNKTAVFA